MFDVCIKEQEPSEVKLDISLCRVIILKPKKEKEPSEGNQMV